MEPYKIASLLIAGIAFIGVTVLGVSVSQKQLGKRTYRKMFPSIVVESALYAVVMGTIFIIFSAAQTTMTVVMASLSLFFAVSLLWSNIKSPPSAPILLDLGPLNSEIARALGVFLVFTVACSIALAAVDYTRYDLTTTILIAAVYCTLGGIYLYQMGRKRSAITSSGVDTGQRFIKWEQIESYEWDRHGSKMDTLQLRLRRRVPVFRTAIIRIPAKYSESVNDLLGQ
jgi:hypothetical protein